MSFEWDAEKSIANKEEHGIDFETAKLLWSDKNRVEIHAPYPVEDRWILIGKKENKLWTVIFDELVKSHIPYVVHASTSLARTEYQ